MTKAELITENKNLTEQIAHATRCMEMDATNCLKCAISALERKDEGSRHIFHYWRNKATGIDNAYYYLTGEELLGGKLLDLCNQAEKLYTEYFRGN